MTSKYETILKDLNSVSLLIFENDGQIPLKYLTPWRGDIGKAIAVVAPKTVQEIKEVIVLAKKYDLKILPQGARTGMVGASVPDISDGDDYIILSTEKIKNRCIYDETEKTLTIDAGFSLSEVNDYLKQYNRYLPINVSSDPLIGAMAATNIAGSSVIKYGDMRELTLGIEIVTADQNNSIYSTLNRLKKDNSFIDLTKTFIGSFGAFGIITATTLKTYPIIENRISAWMAINEKYPLDSLIKETEKYIQNKILAFELISHNAIDQLSRHMSNNSNTVIPFKGLSKDLVFIELGDENPKNNLEEILEQTLGGLIDKQYIVDAQIVPSVSTWGLRHNVSEAVQSSGFLVGCDLSVPRSKITVLREKCRSYIDDNYDNGVVCDFGHIGDGGIHMNVVFNTRDVLRDKNVRYQLSKIAVELGGSFSAEHGIGSFNIGLYEEFTDQTKKIFAQKIKNIMDPENILGHSSLKLGEI